MLEIDLPDLSSNALITKTLDEIVIGWSAAAERLFGYTAQEIIGQPIRRLFPADLKSFGIETAPLSRCPIPVVRSWKRAVQPAQWSSSMTSPCGNASRNG
ncbi:MAG: PAS domain-containing protein [Nitrospira sp. CR1.1]|jgi:PAS domain-containing protein|nr:PAS domain-containing protein [Nitrospira sp. CR1.1]